MLIIEGSDNLGKTILAKKIVRKVSDMGFPVVYSWLTRPNEQIFDFFNDYKKMINPCAVQDRFHLSGLAYHNDKIPSHRLQIINGWIRSIGGLVIVLYAADEEWYEQHIRVDKRKNILSWPIMCEANRRFNLLAKTNRNCDYSFNILPYGFSKDNINFVNDSNVEELIEEWMLRRQALGI